ELRGAHSGDEHATTHPAGILHLLKSGIEGGITTGDILSRGSLAHDNAVADEQLLGKVCGPLGGSEFRTQALAKQRPAALSGGMVARAGAQAAQELDGTGLA